MPLALGEYFLNNSKVIEVINTEHSGNYTIERYKVLDVYSGIHSAFIFYCDGVEFRRDTRVGLLNMLIEHHMKFILNIPHEFVCH